MTDEGKISGDENERVRVAAEAISRYDWDAGISANGRVSRHQRAEARAVLAALDEHFETPAAIEARVRAELAEERQQLRRVAEVSHLFTGDDHWPDCPGCAINAILDVAGSERCGICGGHLTAGGCERHHDTTPEGRDG